MHLDCQDNNPFKNYVSHAEAIVFHVLLILDKLPPVQNVQVDTIWMLLKLV